MLYLCCMNLNSETEYRYVKFGQSGSLKLIDDDVLNEPVSHFTALEDTELEYSQAKGDSPIAITTVPTGLTIHGKITSITIVTGSILVYAQIELPPVGSEYIYHDGDLVTHDGKVIII